MTDDERAIRAMIKTWITASEAGDLDTVLKLMTDDVVFMVPGREPFGKEEFRSDSLNMKNIRIAVVSDIKEIEIAGSWAWTRTHLALTITPEGAKPMRRSGYTLSILKKMPNGAWVIARDANLLAAELEPV